MDTNSFNIPGVMVGPPRDRPFRKGDFKFLILDLLKDKSCYGYEIIRLFEERFHGFYAPSPGVVYPTLQMLEDINYVTSSLQSGKRVYTITEKGRNFLDKKGGIKEKTKRLSGWDNPPNIKEIRRTMRDFVRLAEMLKIEVRKLDAKKLKSIREIFVRAYDEIEDIVKS